VFVNVDAVENLRSQRKKGVVGEEKKAAGHVVREMRRELRRKSREVGTRRV